MLEGALQRREGSNEERWWWGHRLRAGRRVRWPEHAVVGGETSMLPNAGSPGCDFWANQGSSLHQCWILALQSYEPWRRWSCSLFVCRITSSGTDKLTSIFNVPLYVPDPLGGSTFMLRRLVVHSGAKLWAAKQQTACSACQVLSCSDNHEVELQAEITCCWSLVSPPFDWCLVSAATNINSLRGICHVSLHVADPLMFFTNIRFSFKHFHVDLSSELLSLPDGVHIQVYADAHLVLKASESLKVTWILPWKWLIMVTDMGRIQYNCLLCLWCQLCILTKNNVPKEVCGGNWNKGWLTDMFWTTVGRYILARGYELFECLGEYLDHSSIFCTFSFHFFISNQIVKWLDVPVSTRNFVVSCPCSTCLSLQLLSC